LRFILPLCARETPGARRSYEMKSGAKLIAGGVFDMALSSRK
jgi:hypothetical protein